MSKKVREACESHGCFVLLCDNIITREAREEILKCLKCLFDLPEDTKSKHKSPKPYRSYHSTKCPVIPLCESFGIDDVPLGDTARSFTHLMWPHGNPAFCETLKRMGSEMLELNLMVLKMIVEGLGLPKRYMSDAEKMKSTSNLRLMKYRVPSNSKSPEPGLVAHTDKSALTVLCQNEVQGLEVQTKQGKWAWSNGRLHAATHRVMMGGEKERYSFGVFAVPKEEVVIQVPAELVDADHPLRYRPFLYGQYFDFYTCSLQHNALELFAALSPPLTLN
ncbi:putative 2-oxoglutarate-dependent dioxygenase AOP1 [Senna tora]|uniref:Putative 2-oxoglutarate-dependent dioxygenase AOP1 n=1 Tax=Senna tora TaxID=362788 RepID=A0A834WNP2_9FABA|nr:putative 2-oxoglutarate-dependent dioxygenase AOP1 [Senna tora]